MKSVFYYPAFRQTTQQDTTMSTGHQEAVSDGFICDVIVSQIILCDKGVMSKVYCSLFMLIKL